MKAARNTPHLWIVLTAVSVALVVADGGIYLALMYSQDDGRPAWWFVAGLFVAIVLGLGSLRRAGPGAVVVAGVGGIVLLALGVLAVFSVGLPLLAAGILLLVVAAMRLRVRSEPLLG